MTTFTPATQCSDCSDDVGAENLTDGYCETCHAQYGPDLDVRDMEADARTAERMRDRAGDR